VCGVWGGHHGAGLCGTGRTARTLDLCW